MCQNKTFKNWKLYEVEPPIFNIEGWIVTFESEEQKNME
jgi:hypothetical protein